MDKKFTSNMATKVLTRFGKSMKRLLWRNRDESGFVDHLRIPVDKEFTNELADKREEPNSRMKLVEQIVLRAFYEMKSFAELRGFKTRKHTALPAGSFDMSQEMYKASVSRRDMEVPSSVVEVWQHQANQVYKINDYTMRFWESFNKSEVVQLAKWADGERDRLEDKFFTPACALVEYSIGTGPGCFRARKHDDTEGGCGGKQGGDVSKGLMWSARSARIPDSGVQAFLFVIEKSCGATLKNYEDILSHKDPHARFGSDTVYGALALDEWRTTGRTSALIGIDMITSLLTLQAVTSGNKALAKKVGLFLKGRPWDKDWKGKDPWRSVSDRWIRYDSALAGLDPASKPLRKLTKTGATAWGFGAQKDTMSWSMLGLNSNRDKTNVRIGNNLENIIKRIAWPQLLAHVDHDEFCVGSQVRSMKKHASQLDKALKKALGEVYEFNTDRNRLMRNAIEHGCPSIITPDGWVTELEPWSRNRFKGHEVRISFHGDSEDCWVSDLTYNPAPNFQTAEVHTWEAWCMREFVRRFSIAKDRPMADVFDAVYILGCDIELAMRLWTEIIRDMAAHFDTYGSASQQYAALVGDTEFPARQFTADDIDPMCSVMNA